MDETYDEAGAKRRELENLLGQLGDFETLREVGVIGEGELVERRARSRAFSRAIAFIDAGENVTDERVASLLAEAREVAALPTEVEALRADVSDSQDALAELGVLADENDVTLGDVLDAVAELGAIVEAKQ
ncbi:MAG: hypothetical protein RSG23_08660 [Gordonibacter sp.]|uniref:hypothetical protein n=1 Tax=Gordonibacter sp. TaxID=1968902 RepID=UPI002FCC2602